MRGKFFCCLFLVCAALFAAVAPAAAESRYIAQKYSFDGKGFLSSPLTVDFGSQTKTLYVEEIPQSNNSRFLLIAFSADGGEVSVVRLSGSRSYSLYKANLRNASREEVIVLGLGAVNGKNVRLLEIVILGEDRAGTIKPMAVNGFLPLNVLNAPLQLDGRRGLVLSAGAGRKDLRIMWDGVNEEFFTGDQATAKPAAPGEKPATTKDDGVFDEQGN
jgi:hypothetical protein